MPEYQGQTDQTTTVRLTSSILQVLWARPVAASGAQVELEVLTHFVGNGAALQIELSDASGRTLGTFKDRIYGNRFWARITAPVEARDALFADVRLPKHGLRQKSAPLLLIPPVRFTNVKWDKTEARRGDILELTADVSGAPDGTEVEISILEHDEDGAHDFITRFPAFVKHKKVEAEWEFEYHEDTDDIPTAEESEAGYHYPEYFFRVSALGVQIDSPLLRFKDWIEFEATGRDGQPLENAKGKLLLPDGTELEVKLDESGRLRKEGLPPGRCRLRIDLPQRQAETAPREDSRNQSPEESPDQAPKGRYLVLYCADPASNGRLREPPARYALPPDIVTVLNLGVDLPADPLRKPLDVLDGHYDALLIYGSHGDVNASGEPAQFNGCRNQDAFNRHLEALWNSGITADLVFADFCFSLAFLPELSELLTPEGVFVGAVTTATGAGSHELLTRIGQDPTAAERKGLWRDTVTRGQQTLSAFAPDCQGSQFAVYFKQTNSLYRSDHAGIKEYLTVFQTMRDWPDTQAALNRIEQMRNPSRGRKLVGDLREYATVRAFMDGLNARA